MNAQPKHPFAAAPDDPHLDAAPLVRVLCQVQWPEQTVLSTSFVDIADELGIAISADYPIGTSPQAVSFEFDLSGQVRQKPAPPSRQWSSVDEAWWVYFTPVFVTLENRGAYTTRDDMLSRFANIVGEIERLAQLTVAQRVGWRYVNRLDQPSDLDNIEDLVEPTVLGARAIISPSDDVALQQSFSDSLFSAPAGNLIAKWGFLPANTTHDPSVPPATTQSWILDLDAFGDGRVAFESTTLMGRLQDLSDLAYNFFRWAVKPSFLSKFGSKE
ncbi:MAG TPA: TIGR04255 family protein [Galbitalea sp.]|nr:TIGR04255 family protein [Galbitalea sp.]